MGRGKTRATKMTRRGPAVSPLGKSSLARARARFLCPAVPPRRGECCVRTRPDPVSAVSAGPPQVDGVRPEWCVVDRVIARRDAQGSGSGSGGGAAAGHGAAAKGKAGGGGGSEYLVKWKGLGCADSRPPSHYPPLSRGPPAAEVRCECAAPHSPPAARRRRYDECTWVHEGALRGSEDDIRKFLALGPICGAAAEPPDRRPAPITRAIPRQPRASRP